MPPSRPCGLGSTIRFLYIVYIVYTVRCLFSELLETPKSSQISEEPDKLAEMSANAEVSAESESNLSGPTPSALPPDNISSDVEEEQDKTDIADSLPLTTEPDA